MQNSIQRSKMKCTGVERTRKELVVEVGELESTLQKEDRNLELFHS